jgi:hypothetical protein
VLCLNFARRSALAVLTVMPLHSLYWFAATSSPARPDYNWEGRGSQYGQDLWVAQHFNFKLNGVFIDIGANEGAMGRCGDSAILFEPCFSTSLQFSHHLVSNSLLLEKCLGWRGICVEPGLREFAMLSKPGLRSCAAFNAAAAATDGYADFCNSSHFKF